MDVEGRVALVTGAGTRVGRVIALALGKAGMRVGVHYARSERGAREVAEQIIANGSDARTLPGDLTDPATAPRLVEHTAKVFGGFPGQRKSVARPGVIECDYFHRFNLSFSASPSMPGGAATPAPSRGRAVDHIGFDVTNLEEFEKRLVGLGHKFDAPVRQVPNGRTKVAFFTDPWGTYIEVTEKLAP